MSDPDNTTPNTANEVPRDHVTDGRDVDVPEGYENRGTNAATGTPLQPEDARDPSSVPLGEASAAPGQDPNSPIYSDTATSKDDPVADDAVAQAEAETDRQRAALGIDPDKAREQDNAPSRREQLEESRAEPEGGQTEGDDANVAGAHHEHHHHNEERDPE